MDAIAERSLVCVKRTGQRVPVTIRIGRPHRSGGFDWTCPVEATGLREHLPDVHGIDSFQALMLAQGLLRQLLRQAIEEGGRFCEPEGGAPVDLEQMFASGI